MEGEQLTIRDVTMVAESQSKEGDSFFLITHRAFNEHEFEEVRKLAAELCGRIHPKMGKPLSYVMAELWDSE
ncbi:hypothetical protein Syun_009095 [Stephania yunnanensis]|uniref:Uncharacterized protein n=1 Tax=Stephania yunnanensis TaxID=152371 RepID=A0AAP0KDR7_9MAGN